MFGCLKKNEHIVTLWDKDTRRIYFFIPQMKPAFSAKLFLVNVQNEMSPMNFLLKVSWNTINLWQCSGCVCLMYIFICQKWSIWDQHNFEYWNFASRVKAFKANIMNITIVADREKCDLVHLYDSYLIFVTDTTDMSV